MRFRQRYRLTGSLQVDIGVFANSNYDANFYLRSNAKQYTTTSIVAGMKMTPHLVP
jgi:hypothetical protein